MYVDPCMQGRLVKVEKILACWLSELYFVFSLPFAFPARRRNCGAQGRNFVGPAVLAAPTATVLFVAEEDGDFSFLAVSFLAE